MKKSLYIEQLLRRLGVKIQPIFRTAHPKSTSSLIPVKEKHPPITFTEASEKKKAILSSQVSLYTLQHTNTIIQHKNTNARVLEKEKKKEEAKITTFQPIPFKYFQHPTALSGMHTASPA